MSDEEADFVRLPVVTDYDDVPETRNIINVVKVLDKDYNFTELHTAVKENSINLVEALLQKKVPINSQTNNGRTSLLLACLHRVDTNIAKMLIQSGADVNIPDTANFTPLIAACKTQKLDIVELLLQSGANIDKQDACNYTALHYAIDNEDIQLVELLLQAGADTSLVDCNGYNALMMALHDHELCAQKILPFTVDLNRIAFNGWSALMLAVAENISKDIILKLVERGAEVNINVDGNMPVTLALERDEDPSIFDYLWDLTDIDILKDEEEEDGLYNFIALMLTGYEWIIPDKIRYFYKVLNTAGVKLSCGGYIRMIADTMIEFETQEEFLSIDVCGIVNKFLEKGCALIDLDIEGFILMCYRYNFDYKYKLLQVLIDNNANFNDMEYIYLSVVNDPEFSVFLLQYCIYCDPMVVLQYINNVKRLDIPMLKFQKYILRLCTPNAKLREDCIKHLKTFDISSDCCCYAILMSSLVHPCRKYVKKDLNVEEKETRSKLYDDVLDILSKDRLPTLKEMSRDVIRKSLVNNCSTTQDYLNALKLLHLPKFMTDIIQCKSAVVSFD